MNKAFFLDRDGIINKVKVMDGVTHPPQDIIELELMPGIYDCCEVIRSYGYLLIVVTNQPDVARGTQTMQKVEEINTFIQQELKIEDVRVCYHDNADKCDCRKPKPGMLKDAAIKYNIDLSESFILGDRWSDVEAGRMASCHTILFRNPYSQQERCKPEFVIDSLVEIEEILKKNKI